MRKLFEWKDANNNKITLTSTSQPNSSSPKNYPSQEDRYKRLLAQIDSDKICSYTVNELTDRILSITVDTKNKTNLKLSVIYKPYCDPPCYTFMANDKEISNLTYEEILDLFKIAAAIDSTDLCESINSIADDFKLYENLWD